VGARKEPPPKNFTALQRPIRFFARNANILILPASAHVRLILLAEDDPDDITLMRLALQHAALPNPLFVVRDGQETIDYIAGEGPFGNRKTYPLPSLLLLDLKMPRLDGFDVLGWLQNRPQFNQLPRVVLSGSDLEADNAKAMELGAHDYRVKPVGIENLVKLLHQLHACWLDGDSKLSSGAGDS
jgi:CheY-like chemotaxis protein